MKLKMYQEQRQIISPAMMQTFELLMLPAVDLIEELKVRQLENPIMKIEQPKKSKPPRRKMTSFNKFDNQSMLENTPMNESNLYDYLMEQIILSHFSEREIQMARLILSSLDDNGLLTLDPNILIEGTDFKPEELEQIRRRIQRLDPIGVGSFNYQEYLQIQIEEKLGADSMEYIIISQYADLLEKKLYSRIAKKMNISYGQIEKAVENISKLNRSPAVNFSKALTQYVVPDATVSVQDGEIKVILLDDYMPEIKINDRYIHDVFYKNKEEKLKNFIHKKVLELFNNLEAPEEEAKLKKALVKMTEDFILGKAKDLLTRDSSQVLHNNSRYSLYSDLERSMEAEIRNFVNNTLQGAVQTGADSAGREQSAVLLSQDSPVLLSQDSREKMFYYLKLLMDTEVRQYVEKDTKEFLDKDTREYISQKKSEVNTLIENLRSRKEIIFKVICKIVEKQKDFFLKGAEYQIPLKLKNIADELNIHESTVSRVVKDKYIQTDRGIVSLKKFFSTQIGDSDTSSSSVKDALKKIVENEDKDDPLSDDKIVRILKNKGIAISRRTVTKYRDDLGIPAAYIRRNPL